MSILSPRTATLEERKIVVDDILEVAEHEIEASLKKKESELQAEFMEAIEALEPPKKELKEKIDKCVKPHMNSLKSEFSHPFSIVNAVEAPDRDFNTIECEMDYSPTFSFPKRSTAGFSKWEKDMAVASLKKWAEWKSGDNIPVSVTIEIYPIDKDDERGDEMSFSFNIWVVSSSDVEKSIEKFLKKSKLALEIADRMKIVEGQLSNLDKTMKELKMQAVSSRIKEMGGEGLLKQVLDSANQSLGGLPVSGVSMTLPDYRTKEPKTEI